MSFIDLISDLMRPALGVAHSKDELHREIAARLQKLGLMLKQNDPFVTAIVEHLLRAETNDSG